MTKLSRYRVSPTRSNDAVCRMMADAEKKSTMMLTAGRYDGRRVELNHRMLYNFGTCSYMGLDRNLGLQKAAADAVFAYGTQFSISRAYLECPMYTELETLLQEITGRPVFPGGRAKLLHPWPGRTPPPLRQGEG